MTQAEFDSLPFEHRWWHTFAAQWKQLGADIVNRAKTMPRAGWHERKRRRR